MSNDPQPAAAAPPGRPILEPGARVGRFQVEALIGSGGMGEVYRAWDATLERSVALKALRPGEEREAGATERFRREALALAQLNHPNVCHVHDWVDGPDGAFIAMELVAGQTLDQAAPDLKLREKLQVIRSVALALEAAHAKGLVHRDLKPGNIMVARGEGGEGLQVKVLDFGLARLIEPQGPDPQLTPATTRSLPRPPLPGPAESGAAPGAEATEHALRALPKDASGPHSWSRLTQVGSFVGSPSYASPEQIQGQTAGSSSDVFSLGIVAWELLTGENPFPGEGRARMRAIVEGARRELRTRGLPSGTGDLLVAMLETHPFKRPTSAKVSEALARLLRPRSALRWSALSVAGALLLAAGANWFLGRGIIADLTRQRPARLLVLPFANGSGDPKLDSLAHFMLPEMLGASLRQHPKLAPVDLDLLSKARTSLHLDPKGILEPAAQARLVSALGAQLVLSGTLSKAAGGGFSLAYRLSDAKGAARHAGEARESGGQAGVILPLVRKLSEELTRAVDPFSARSRGSLPDIPPQALEAYARAAELMDRGDFKGAAPVFQTAVQASPDFVPAVLDYARCLSRLADVPPEPVFQWARWAASAQGNRFYEMKALHYLAVRHGDRGQWEASQRASRQALELARALGEVSFEAGIRATIGVNLQRQHKDAEAEAEYQQALAMNQAVGDRLNATRTLNNLAALEKGRGNLKGAEARYQGALETVLLYGDKWGEAVITNNLGDLALAQDGGLDRAESFYRKARTIREALGDQNGLAYTLMGLASVAQARGELDRALELTNLFLDQSRRTHLLPLEALAFYNLGELQRAAGRLETARGFYRQSLALHQDLKDEVMEAHCLAAEAECLARDGRRAMARALLDRSQLLSSDETPYILRARGWLARADRREDEARSLFAKALAAARLQAPEIVRELKEAAR